MTYIWLPFAPRHGKVWDFTLLVFLPYPLGFCVALLRWNRHRRSLRQCNDLWKGSESGEKWFVDVNCFLTAMHLRYAYTGERKQSILNFSRVIKFIYESEADRGTLSEVILVVDYLRPCHKSSTRIKRRNILSSTFNRRRFDVSAINSTTLKLRCSVWKFSFTKHLKIDFGFNFSLVS